MKNLAKTGLFLGLWSCIVTTAWGSLSPRAKVAAAVEAIEQAPDPSAVVSAFANGVAIDGNDPKLYETYVARMVYMGLPELAYHQAQTLTSMEPKNGLAWGVIAHVEARRGRMPEAVSAIIRAGKLAPDDKFVQRTAGEILAWYDLKAVGSELPEEDRKGVDKLRSRLEKEVAFNEAYEIAKKAYETESSGQGVLPVSPQSSATTSSGFAVQSAQPSPSYYPDNYGYYYVWGPGWVEPAPWWWWQPAGYFAGTEFVPFGTVVVFDDDDFFRHHDRRLFDRDRLVRHDWDRRIFHSDNPIVWHHDARAERRFFGAPARPHTLLAQRTYEGYHSAPPASAARRAPIVQGPAPISSGFHGGAGSPGGFGGGHGRGHR